MKVSLPTLGVSLAYSVQIKLVSRRFFAICEGKVWCVIVLFRRSALDIIVFFSDAIGEPPKTAIYLLGSTQDTGIGVDEFICFSWRAVGLARGVDVEIFGLTVTILVTLMSTEFFFRLHD